MTKGTSSFDKRRFEASFGLIRLLKVATASMEIETLVSFFVKSFYPQFGNLTDKDFT